GAEEVSAQFQFRMRGSLVGGRNAGEILDHIRASLRVKPLGVAGLANFNGRVDEDLDEPPGRHDLANQVTVGAIRRNKGRDANRSMAGKQLRHLADASNVLGAVDLGKPQVGAKSLADVIAVEQANLAAPIEQLPLQFGGNGGLARSRES